MKKNCVYGFHAVKEAILAGKTIDKIWITKSANKQAYSDIQSLGLQFSIHIQRVPEVAIDKFCKNKNHQGILAFISLVDYQPYEEVIIQIYERGEPPMLMLLEGVTDVRNVGAIARSVECLGGHLLLLPQKNGAAINDDTAKASAGAIYHLPIARYDNLSKTISSLKEMGIFTIACTEKTNESIYSFDLSRPVCWILGDEHEGLSSKTLNNCDAAACIPMKGKISSLNVSVAAGIVLSETLRQRNT